MAADGVNIWLCIVIAIITVAIVAINVYILVYFQNEEDKNTAIFPKIVTVFTFSLIFISILMLPLDVANEKLKGSPQNKGIPMDTLNLVVYVTEACLCFIVPFAFFYYEAEDPDQKSNGKQIKAAIKWDLVWALAFFIPTFILWLFFGKAEVPVIKMYSNLQPFTGEPPALSTLSMFSVRGKHLTYRVSFILYLISMIAFVGAFLLVLFGGIGLAALPMDLINAYRKRAKRMDARTYAEKKLMIGQRAGALLEKGNALKTKFARSGSTRPNNRKDLREYNRFRTGVFIIEQEFKKLERAYGKGQGPQILWIIWEYVQLVLGIICIGLSATWVLHIILYMAPRVNPVSLFLNRMFIDLDNAFSLFGVVAYSLYSFYLLWCVIKGNFKFGVRVPMLCSIHPMKVGETMMNAFLFNAFVLLLASVAVVKFCSQAFSAYARYTYIDIIFNVGVENLQGIKYFWWYGYYYALMLIALLAGVWLFINPSDKKAVNKDLEEDLPMI